MSKKVKSYWLLEETIQIIEELSSQTGKPQSQIIDEAVKLLYSNENKTKDEIELYKKENEQLKMVIKVFQEREKAVEEIKNVYERLISEKDQRIKELQERLKEKSKPFWKFC